MQVIFSSVSWLTTVTSYKMITRTEFANSEPLLPGEIQDLGFYEPLVAAAPSTDKCVTLLCEVLFRDILFNTFPDSITVNSGPTARREAYPAHTIFSVKHVAASLYPGTRGSIKALCFKKWSHWQNAKKHSAPEGPGKRPLLQWEPDPQQSIILGHLPRKHVQRAGHAHFSPRCSRPRMVTAASQGLPGDTNTSDCVGEFADTESGDDGDWLWSVLHLKCYWDVKDKHGHQGRKEGWDELGDWDWHIYTVDIMHKRINENVPYSTGDSTQCSVET